MTVSSIKIVTGATGLVGSHLMIQLVLKKQHVVALKRSTSDIKLVESLFKWYKVPQKDFYNLVSWVDVDITDFTELNDIIKCNSEVYHCAALVSFNPQKKKEVFKTNVEGTANLVDVCLQNNVRKFCYTSSVATLSEHSKQIPLNENSYWVSNGNQSNYAQSKHLSEMEVWRGIQEGLSAAIVNPSIILGPHDFRKGSIKMIETSAHGLPFYTNGSTGFVDANDVAKAMIQLMESNIHSERYVLNGTNISYRDFFSKTANLLKVKKPYIPFPNLLSGAAWRYEKMKERITNREPLITKETAKAAMNRTSYDASKIIKAMNFEFTPIEQTLNNVCEFYLHTH